jgi:AraC family transcriptional regulator, regulatory protein of adaptative response / DNA-3-methyladenine glycosylase II
MDCRNQQVRNPPAQRLTASYDDAMTNSANTQQTTELADREGLYAALLSRDARFDGRFFVGVTSTKVYCRPVCRVRTPLLRNCQFFGRAATAESAGFRPCLRCRPELAPGLSRVDATRSLASHAVLLLDATASSGESLTMSELSAKLGVSDRHLRRIFTAEVGVSPLVYLTTRRLLLAKQLLTDTALTVTTVAHAAGFGSIRQFNAAFAERYRLRPTALRQQRHDDDVAQEKSPCLVRLGFRPPYDSDGLRRFFKARAVPGLEQVSEADPELLIERTLALDHQGQRRTGWLRIARAVETNNLMVSISEGLVPATSLVLRRVRHALDLDAEPEQIDRAVTLLGLGARPGLRLPGAFDGFEAAVRVVLGQQVTVAAALTLTSRLVQRLGEPLPDAHPTLNRLFPTPQAIAAAEPSDIGTLGIVRQRVEALQAVARAIRDGDLSLECDAPLEPTLHALRQLRGIGEWSTQLIAMRALGWPDAFPATDIAMLKALGTRDPKEAEQRVEACRPWRAYAVMRSWQTLESTK